MFDLIAPLLSIEFLTSNLFPPVFLTSACQQNITQIARSQVPGALLEGREDRSEEEIAVLGRLQRQKMSEERHCPPPFSRPRPRPPPRPSLPLCWRRGIASPRLSLLTPVFIPLLPIHNTPNQASASALGSRSDASLWPYRCSSGDDEGGEEGK